MRVRTASAIALAAALTLAGVAVEWAPLNQDEGWLLYAAAQVAKGGVLYRDFAFTQPPVFPTVYAFASPLVGALGIWGGRAITVGFGLATLALVRAAARRRAPVYAAPLAGLLTLLLLGLNPVQIQFWATVKTYALASLLLTGGVALFVRIQDEPGRLRTILCGMLFALAAGTRISLLVFPLPLGVALWSRRRDTGTAAAFLFFFAYVGTLLLVFLPFLLLAPEGVVFGLWEFHTGRDLEHALAVRGAFLLRWLRAVLPAALLLAVLWPKRRRFLPETLPLLTGALGVTAVHLLAPFPYDEYQTILLPVFALVIALEAPRAFPGTLRRRAPVWLLGFALLFAAASPTWEDWFGGPRDRFWWPAKSRSDLADLRLAASRVEALDPGGTLLLTVDTYLAVETGRAIPPGMEMGPFGYFPHMDGERAERLHLLNTERLLTRISQTEATAAALSGYAFAIQGPGLTPTPPGPLRKIEQAVALRFSRVEEIENFGQADTELRVYVRKGAGEE